MLQQRQGGTSKLSISTWRFILSVAISGFASGVIAFALDVWVYEQTHSYAIFALIVTASELPNLLVLPITGMLVDRLPRKRLMLAADLSTASISVALAALSIEGQLHWQLAGLLFCAFTLCRAMQAVAGFASISVLTSNEARPAANGQIESFNGAIAVLAPIAGGVCYEFGGLSLTGSICCLLYVLAVAIRAPVRIDSTRLNAFRTADVQAFGAEYAVGFKWIWQHAELRRLALFFTAVNCGASIYVIANRPYFLSFISPTLLSWVAAIIGLGVLFGGIAVRRLGQTGRDVVVIAIASAAVGVVEISIGLARAPIALMCLGFFYGFCVPLINSTNAGLWQALVPAAMQGRVFAARQIMTAGMKPLIGFLSIPFATYAIAPVMTFSVFGISPSQIWGVDNAAPLGLLVSLCGFVILLSLPILIGVLSLSSDRPYLATAVPSVSNKA